MKTALTLHPESATDLQESFKLIDGTYEPSEAADVLFSVLGDKIRFHNIQILSAQERFNADTSVSEKRLHELKESKHQVADLILKARDNNYEIEINGVINITLKEK
tara:strand:- start:68944 stop:69261 length:318 start_codon:yes stop_codon:yes gene_type:complete